ncbi:hypothetical protein EOPP23_19385 [Endozoicomonas sp. OPT23]|uniref:NAD-dependent epimerase/dehydratase family protein n=1 Tax=Endozoicomonas sp. OPT23 TaxID=2072845 RepID=UPI00129A7200|nr:NAD-dependent epimerase/dehydratase family protein [Endozoicomonas sp. OPT23]MRI35133.1 hypothetical protein [Endozoicomonas sp. OPT23]
MSKTALITGATGAIGNHLLTLLLASNDYEKVVYIGRQNLPEHTKLEQLIHPIEQWLDIKLASPIDIAFCCLGTTIKQAGSKEAFKKVDLQAVLDTAALAKQSGCEHFSVISSAGVEGKLPSFYLDVKREMETKLKAKNFKTLHTFRPSLLKGERNEFRLGESAAELFFQAFSPLIPKKLLPVSTLSVARAMLHHAGNSEMRTKIISRETMD